MDFKFKVIYLSRKLKSFINPNRFIGKVLLCQFLPANPLIKSLFVRIKNVEGTHKFSNIKEYYFYAK
jgi:hypothetical protein